MTGRDRDTLCKALLYQFLGALGFGLFLGEMTTSEVLRARLFGGLADAVPHWGYGWSCAAGAAFLLACSLYLARLLAEKRNLSRLDAFYLDARSNLFPGLLALDWAASSLLAAVLNQSEYLPLSPLYKGVFVTGLWLAAKVFLWQKEETRETQAAGLAPDRALRLAWMACGVYVLVFGALGVLQCLALCVQQVDSMTFEQMYWFTAKGYFGQAGPAARTFFAEHVAVTMYLLLPLYLLHPALETLAVFQTVGIGLGAVPVYLIAREVLKRRGAALAFSIAYLASPALHYSNLEVRDNVFDPNSFSAMLILWAFYGALKKRWNLYFVFSALAMLCREDACPSVFAMGLYVALVLRERKAGLAGAAMGLGWLLLCLFLIIPHFQGERSLVFNYYRELGEGPGGMIRYVLSHPLQTFSRVTEPSDLSFVIELALPFGFLAFLSPSALLMAAPAFAFSMLADPRWSAMVSIQFWYHIIHIPLVTIASIMGARRLPEIVAWLDKKRFGGPEKGWANAFRKRAPNACGALVLACSFGLSLFLSKWPLSFNFYNPGDTYRYYDRYIIPGQVRFLPEIQSLVPESASVCTTRYLLQKFSHHPQVYHFPSDIDRSDYVIINQQDRWFRLPFDTSGDRKAIRDMAKRKDFRKIYERGGFLVYRKELSE